MLHAAWQIVAGDVYVSLVLADDAGIAALSSPPRCSTRWWKRPSTSRARSTTRWKVAKDVAAGAVLVTAIGAIVAGLFLFVPHLAR